MSLEQDIKNIVESCGAKLYDIETVSERGKTIYRVTITDKEGVSLDKCVQISQLISPLLDVHPPVQGDYNLEVSSPGIERKLKKLSHFENSIGEKVRITTIDGEVYEGELVGVEDKKIMLQTSQGKISIDFDNISSAKTYFEW
ncbi:ribosome maturation factor RimP [Nitratiruptor sp. YY08-26]|uniref:ribosome maturation factor RimP n=1 Tax=unclassified Nitratiruptor TaxID=2624044 RepID=UPI001915F895|nr:MULTISPECIES: ribosome maturation factor RimP [unclassified Nitratiruptor]BCD61610.1 ribosome maturation factor RimP [Nitratiruptor sp. YY08-13]BCD65544.1 ribosome maturation factor RimP [Nitratiruptor sp. YY08-26]